MTPKTFALAAFAALAGTHAFADPIAGNWRLENGVTANIAACGSAFCIRLTSGAFSGRQIGRVTPDGDRYVGTLVDPTDDREYRGTATVSGASLEMEGCALRVFCRSQTWQRM